MTLFKYIYKLWNIILNAIKGNIIRHFSNECMYNELKEWFREWPYLQPAEMVVEVSVHVRYKQSLTKRSFSQTISEYVFSMLVLHVFKTKFMCDKLEIRIKQK